MNAADLVVEELAASEADLRAANRQLVEVVADLAFENAILRQLLEHELIFRIHADALIARLQRKLHPQDEDAA